MLRTGTAMLSQYWGGLAPCELCLAQRWPWAAAIAIAMIALLFGRQPALPWVGLVLVGVFAIGVALAFYHVGVEQHWFAGPTACSGAATAADTLEALKAQILHQQPVRCDEPAWSLWGISLAGWASGSKFPLLGSVRSTAQMISYELSMSMSVIGVLILAGSTSLSAIVSSQARVWFIVPQIVGPSSLILGQAVYAQQGLAGNIPLAAAFAVVPIVVMGIFLTLAKRMGAFDAL